MFGFRSLTRVMRSQALFALFISFCLGLFFADTSLLRDRFVLLILLLGFVLFVLGCRFCRLFEVSTLLLFFVMGAFFLQTDRPLEPSDKIDARIDAQFVLKDKLSSNRKARRYIVEVQDIKSVSNKEVSPFLCLFHVSQQEPKLNFENIYSSRFYIRRIPVKRDDQDFDYSEYMARRKIFFQAFASEEIQSRSKNLSFLEKIRQRRMNLLDKIDESSLSLDAREFLKGIVLADRTEMNRETLQGFRKSGLAHVLAISGTHIGILFHFLLGFLGFFFWGRGRKIAILTSLLLIWTFYCFTDYGSSTFRACIMISVYYTSVFLQRKPDLLHSLALSGLVILMINPMQLFDLGFQLSFLSVFGIYWLYKPILKIFPRPKNKLFKLLMSTCSITISVQVMILPLVLYHFHEFSPSFLLFNLLIIPFLGLIIILSFLMFLFVVFIGDVSYFNAFYDGVISGLLTCVHFFARLDPFFFSEFRVSYLEGALLVLCALLLRAVLEKKRSIFPVLFGFVLLSFFALRLFSELPLINNYGLGEGFFYHLNIDKFLTHSIG